LKDWPINQKTVLSFISSFVCCRNVWRGRPPGEW